MKPTLLERLFLNLKTTLSGLALIAGALYAAQTDRIAAADKATLVVILAGAGVVLLGAKDPRRRKPAKHP
jgi:hypothetical protein